MVGFCILHSVYEGIPSIPTSFGLALPPGTAAAVLVLVKKADVITPVSDFSNLVGKAFCVRARDNSQTWFPAILKGIYHA